MISIVRDIGESNAFIASIAINAAILSAKADVRGGELVKVSEAISEQAKRNTANTDVIRKILEEMNKTVIGHFDFLSGLVSTIGQTANNVSQSGNILDKAGPLLESANEMSNHIESTSMKLATLIQEASYSVNQIHEEVDQLSLHAETLQFGLDMEQGVSDILKDVAEINKSVSEHLSAL